MTSFFRIKKPNAQALQSRNDLLECRQVGNQVRTLLQVFNLKAHALAGNEFFRIFQPSVEGLRGPAQPRTGQLLRVLVAGQTAHTPPYHAPVGWADLVAVYCMAGGAARLVQLEATLNIAGRRCTPFTRHGDCRKGWWWCLCLSGQVCQRHGGCPGHSGCKSGQSSRACITRIG